MTKDRSDQGPNWLSHRSAHQKDRSTHALRQTDICVRMHCKCINCFIVTLDSDNKGDAALGAESFPNRRRVQSDYAVSLTHCVALSRRRTLLSAAMLCVLWADVRGCRPAVNYCWSCTSRRQSHTSSRSV